MCKKLKNNRGMVTVEATIALTAFLFFFMMLYCVITISRAQAIIGSALDSTAKEISQYTYIYGLTNIQESTSSVFDTNVIKEDVNGFVDKLNNSLNAMQKLKEDGSEILNTGVEDASGIMDSWDTIMQDIEGVSDSGSEVYDGFSELMEDPKGLIIGLCKIGAEDGLTLVKSKLLAPPVCRGLIKKHLVSEKGGDVESYLQQLRVVPNESATGNSYLKALDFSNSVLFSTSDYDIVLRVEYELKLIPFLPVDLRIKICQSSITRGWAKGDGKKITLN